MSEDKSRQFENTGMNNQGVHPAASMSVYINLKANSRHVTKQRITRQNWKSPQASAFICCDSKLIAVLLTSSLEFLIS